MATSIHADCEVNEVFQITSVKAKGGFPPYSFNWSGGVVSGLNNTEMKTYESGSYRLEVIDQQGCSYEKAFVVDLPEKGEPSFSSSSYSLGEYHVLSIEDPIQFTSSATGEYTSISWDFGDGSPIIFEENPTYTYSMAGTYAVSQTVEYSYGCTNTFTSNVEVTKGYLLILPNSFTPNDDSINDTVRPVFKGMKDVEMSIYDTWGSLIYYEKGLSLEGWDGRVQGKPAENGNYVMVVEAVIFYDKMIRIENPITLLK